MEINMHHDSGSFYILKTSGLHNGTIFGREAHKLMFEFLDDKATLLNRYRRLKNAGFYLKLHYKF